MDADGLTYKLAADAKDFIKGLKSARDEVKDLSEAAGNTSLKKLTADTESAQAKVKELGSAFHISRESVRKFAETLIEGEGAVGKLGSSLQANLIEKASEAGPVLMGMGLAIAGVAGALKVAIGALEGYAELDSARRAMKVLEGSAASAAQRLKELAEIAEKPAVDYEMAQQADIKLRHLGMTARESKALMEEVGNAVALAGGGKEQFADAVHGFEHLIEHGEMTQRTFIMLAESIPQIKEAFRDAFGTDDMEKVRALGLTLPDMINRVVEAMSKWQRATSGAKNELEKFGQTYKETWLKGTEAIAGSTGKIVEWGENYLKFVQKAIDKTERWFGMHPPDLGKDTNKSSYEDDLNTIRRRSFEAAKAKMEVDAAARAEQEKKDAEARAKRESEERKTATETKAITERIWAQTLSERENLVRKIDALKDVSGPNLSIDYSTDEGLKKAGRFAELLELRKKLTDIDRRAAEAKEAADIRDAELNARAMEANERKIEQLNREFEEEKKKAEKIAESVKAFDLENQILAAQGMHRTNLYNQLEKEKHIEELKLQIMQQQGLEEGAALNLAKQRVALEDAAKPQKKARGLLSREDQLREEWKKNAHGMSFEDFLAGESPSVRSSIEHERTERARNARDGLSKEPRPTHNYISERVARMHEVLDQAGRAAAPAGKEKNAATGEKTLSVVTKISGQLADLGLAN